MTNYRRCRLPGATYFFTVAIAERHLDLLVGYIEDLKAPFRDEHQRAPFVNVALVVLPDHLHAIWRLPKDDSDYSQRRRRIKAGFSRALPLGERVYNPVKHGLVPRVSVWPHSTFHRYVQRGVYTVNWCDSRAGLDIDFGE